MDVNNKFPALREWWIISYPYSLVHSYFNVVFNCSWAGKYAPSRETGTTSLDVVSQIQELEQLLRKVGVDEKSRRAALKETQNLVRALERPEEVVMRQAFETHTYNLCLRLGVDLKVFRILMASNNCPISAEELAKKTGAEKQFLVRIMRVITALNYAEEVSPQIYVSTPLTKAITLPSLEACMVHSYEHAAKVNIKMPEYFRINGYKSPTNVRDGPFQYALNTKLTYFDYLHQDPRKVQNFNTFMSGNRNVRRHWVEWFPVRQILLDDFLKEKRDLEDVLLVDMGGGQGHDLERFAQTFPEANSHLVLQDLSGTIKSLKDFGRVIKPMVHDIFTPQPILGAKAYYTHFVLHDFPDEECRDILRHIAKAMKPGYSRIILNETVLPDIHCPAFFAAGDITMMAVLAAMKRSRAQWTELLESVGLKVMKIWTSPDPEDSEGVIEAMLELA